MLAKKMDMANKASLSSLEQGVLAQFKSEVLRICGTPPPSLHLFGSRARGEGGEDSDVDVLVLLPTANEGHKIKIWDAAYYIFDQSGIHISPLVLTKEQFARLQSHERRIAKEINQDGVIL
jgi:predicted nucleotidyltransferase